MKLTKVKMPKAPKTWRGILASHGLDKVLKFGTSGAIAEKKKGDDSIIVEKIGVREKEFVIRVCGHGFWRKYLEREAATLQKSLSKFGKATIEM